MTANEDMERFKLVIAGDRACGKTSLLTAFKNKKSQTRFDLETPTANVTVDGKPCELTLWDTHSQEEFDR